MQETFFEALFSLARLSLRIKDEFLKEKLGQKTKEFFSAAQLIHLQGLALQVDKSTKQEERVAQSSDFATCEHIAKSANVVQHGKHVVQHWRLLQVVNDLNEFIEILMHLKLVDLSPALLTQKSLLRFKADIIGPAVFVKEKSKEAISSKSNLSKKAIAAQKNAYLKKKIVNYLKSNPNGAQTKDLIEHLKNELPRRTLQRYLNDLVDSGLVKKDQLNGFPRYFLQ